MANEKTDLATNPPVQSDPEGSQTAGTSPKILLKLLAIAAVALLVATSFYLGRASVPIGGGAKAAGSSDTSKPLAGLKKVEGVERPTSKNAKTEAEVAGDLKEGTDYAPSHDQVAQALAAAARNKADDPRALGPVDAPVKFLEFADYSCPMCTKFQLDSMGKMKELAQAGKIRIEWHDLPIFAGKHGSDVAAAGGIAAGNQGKFWEYLDQAFKEAGTGHPDYTPDSVTKIAQGAGVKDLAKFRADLDSAETQQQIKKEGARAQELGLSGTPAFFVGNAYISGAMPTQFFVNTILIQGKLAGSK